MIFYPLCVAAVTLLLVRLHGLYVLVPFSAAICLAGLGYALYRPDMEVVNLPPALQSAWFVPHVVTYFIAYAALFISCVLAVIEIVRQTWLKNRPESFETYANQAAIFGLVALTLGLIMGGMWGKYAWGDYWSWDPKENWALVTWLAYLLYFHLRRIDGWQGRRGMIVLALASRPFQRQRRDVVRLLHFDQPPPDCQPAPEQEVVQRLGEEVAGAGLKALGDVVGGAVDGQQDAVGRSQVAAGGVALAEGQPVDPGHLPVKQRNPWPVIG